MFGFTDFYDPTGTAPTGSNNCSDVAITFGTNNQELKTYANQFEVTTDAERDFRTKAGADLINNGVTDLTNLPSADDITGLSRLGAWDIGAWEVEDAYILPSLFTDIDTFPSALVSLQELGIPNYGRVLHFETTDVGVGGFRFDPEYKIQDRRRDEVTVEIRVTGAPTFELQPQQSIDRVVWYALGAVLSESDPRLMKLNVTAPNFRVEIMSLGVDPGEHVTIVVY